MVTSSSVSECDTYVKIRKVKLGGLRLRVFPNEMNKSHHKVFQAKLGGYVFACF